MSSDRLADFRLSPFARRLLRSLVCVIAPPGEAEALGIVEEVVDEAELMMRSMPAHFRVALQSGMMTYDLAAAVVPRNRGKRAWKLEEERARAYYEAWRHGTAIQRNFIKGLKVILGMSYCEHPRVLEKIDYTPQDWIAKVTQRRLDAYAGEIEAHEKTVFEPDPIPLPSEVGEGAEAPPPSRPASRIRPPTREIHSYSHAQPPPGVFARGDIRSDTEVDCDVVIVGSGAGGATAAAELAEAGFDVVVLEEGSYYGTSDFTPRAGEMVRKMYRDGGACGALGRPPIMYQEGRTVGGSAVVNGGMSWRTPERILDRWATESGLAHMRAADLEPYFERVERRIHVAHQDPESIGRDSELLRKGAEKMGWEYDSNLRNQLHCAGANNCAFGCPTGAKQSTLVTYIPRALHFGARIYSDVRVEQITRAGKRATGVEGRVVQENGKPGHRLVVNAKLVVSACGSIHTPALFSRSGFRSPSGQLGRNLTLHPNIKVIAVFDEAVRGWEGVHQAYQVREFAREGIQTMAAVNVPPGVVAMTVHHYGEELRQLLQDYERTVIAGLSCEDTTTGRVRTTPGGRPITIYNVTDTDLERLKRATSLLCELLLAAGAQRIIPPFEGIGEICDVDDARKIVDRKIPRSAMEIVTVHLMGTARMGARRSDAVTDEFGRVYDADRLFVCDASVFPSAVAVNPCETIQALSTRNAAHIIENRKRYLRS